MDLQQKVGIRHAVEAGKEIHLKGSMNVVIKAGTSIILKAGGGFVAVDPVGVTVSVPFSVGSACRRPRSRGGLLTGCPEAIQVGGNGQAR